MLLIKEQWLQPLTAIDGLTVLQMARMFMFIFILKNEYEQNIDFPGGVEIW